MTTPAPTSLPFTKEKTFSSYTQDQGQKYASARRDYHPKLYQAVIDHHVSTGGQLDTLIDIGCGPGNVTRSLAPHFAHAIGLDPSEGMLTTARAQAVDTLTSASEPVRFELSTAEELGTTLARNPVQEGSVDLIAAGNAAHWFDLSGFWPAAARVLKPGGTVALWTSGSIKAHPTLPNAEAINRVMEEHRDNELRAYITAGNLIARNSYRDLPLPWTIPMPVPEFPQSAFFRKAWGPSEGPFFAIEGEVDMDTFEKMLATGSPETRWRQDHPDLVGTEKDVLRVMRRKIEQLLQEAGVEKGKERVRGSVDGAILFFKKV